MADERRAAIARDWRSAECAATIPTFENQRDGTGCVPLYVHLHTTSSMDAILIMDKLGVLVILAVWNADFSTVVENSIVSQNALVLQVTHGTKCPNFRLRRSF
jgi:hypothetical protein